MNPKKTKEKERRRARKLAEQAWEAAEEQNLDLAEKLIRRAVTTQIDNPVLWNDQGMLLAMRSKDAEAEEAFRTALSLAPNYAEPYAHLAAIRIRQGYLQDGIQLMEKAVQYSPNAAGYADRLESYRALIASSVQPVERQIDSTESTPTTSGVVQGTEDALAGQLTQKLETLNWQEIGERLTYEGCALVQSLLDPPTCLELGQKFEDNSLFAKTVVMDREDFGRGAYRYYRQPIPATVDAIRRALYPYVACIANRWQHLLNEPERFPDEWEGFRGQCREAGQSTPTPILLKYGPGGFNALHRDLRGTVYFPIQMAVVLSARADSAETDLGGFRGGDFLFCDVPERKKSRRRMIPAGLGDAVLFCTRDRLVSIGGAYGLQPVKHGVTPITAGTRLVLGVPFHEYR